MKRVLITVVLIALFPVLSFSQAAASFHVFPQVADGVSADGSYYYQSILITTAVTAESTTCKFKITGPSTTRVLAGGEFNLQGVGAVSILPTFGNLFSLASGYGTLTCNQPVSAVLAYLSINLAADIPTAGAAVFSSPPVLRAQLVLNQTVAKTGVAIANDTDNAATYTLTLKNQNNQPVATGTVTVQAHSSVAKFADELISIPKDFVGAILVSSSGSATFSIIGLSYIGNAFLTQPAAVLP